MDKGKISEEEKLKIEIENLSKIDSTILGKDKIHSLNSLVNKINTDYNLIKKYEDELTIDYLKHQCFRLEESILDAKTFSSENHITEKRERALDYNIKQAIKIQNEFENKLISLGDSRDKDYENELFAAFDFELDAETKLISEKTTPTSTTKKSIKKAGRPKAVVKEAKEYLKFELEENKAKFITELTNQFSKADIRIFNELMKILSNQGIITNATNKEIKESFEKALGRKPQSQQNFDKQFKAGESADSKKILKKINEIINDNTIV
ncbi:hypothetical protein [Zobellia nedashkovskayae]|uniref:hypothetical protein n=1 Tax=Zobellia nedashkovskayae TaxID=2779510 RepID=UPI00188AD80B|nr:hypothetical protein [Zobellia nedashkovskayae]